MTTKSDRKKKESTNSPFLYQVLEANKDDIKPIYEIEIQSNPDPWTENILLKELDSDSSKILVIKRVEILHQGFFRKNFL